MRTKSISKLAKRHSCHLYLFKVQTIQKSRESKRIRRAHYRCVRRKQHRCDELSSARAEGTDLTWDQKRECTTNTRLYREPQQTKNAPTTRKKCLRRFHINALKESKLTLVDKKEKEFIGVGVVTIEQYMITIGRKRFTHVTTTSPL